MLSPIFTPVITLGKAWVQTVMYQVVCQGEERGYSKV